MKKCPKCGTILDDSKKQCYMCGTNLETAKLDLTENKSVGAIVSGDGNNGFEKKGKFGGADAPEEKKREPFFNQDDKDNLNSLNAAPEDKRSKLQKGFDSIFGNKKFKDKTDISKASKEPKDKKKKGAVEDNQPKGPQARKNSMELVEHKKETKLKAFGPAKEEKKNVITQEEGNNLGKPFDEKEFEAEKNVIDQTFDPKPKKEVELPVEEPVKEEKVTSFGFLNEIPEEDPKAKKHDFGFTKNNTNEAPVNDKDYEFHAYKPSFMDKVKGMFASKTTRGYKDGREDFKFSGQMFVNIIAIIFFVCVLYYVWNFVINKKADTTLSGLVYEINPDFKRKVNTKTAREYEYNKDCVIRIELGGDTSEENYIEEIKGLYESYEGTTVQYEQLKIHSNIWSSLAVIEFSKDSAGIGGETLLPKYRYTVINHKGDFFVIKFINTYQDKTCQKMYDEFSKTLNFKEG